MMRAIVNLLMVASVSSYTSTPLSMGLKSTPDMSTKVGSSINQNRRGFFQTLTSAATFASLSTFSNPNLASATESSDLTDVYFGVGCFWHIQHEFVEAERNLLERSDKQLTSRTGYAGGTQTKDGKICYHNFQSFADYGKMGHGEVVGMSIPESSIGDFAKEYFNLFTPKGERVDPMDRGGEYRSLLGLPGGAAHPMYPEVEKAAIAKGMTLENGKGNDPDTLGRKLVYVYDTKSFPFYQGEVYHQFHNDFQSPAYGKEYNDLVNVALDNGRVEVTGCPDRI